MGQCHVINHWPSERPNLIFIHFPSIGLPHTLWTPPTGATNQSVIRRRRWKGAKDHLVPYHSIMRPAAPQPSTPTTSCCIRHRVTQLKRQLNPQVVVYKREISVFATLALCLFLLLHNTDPRSHLEWRELLLSVSLCLGVSVPHMGRREWVINGGIGLSDEWFWGITWKWAPRGTMGEEVTERRIEWEEEVVVNPIITITFSSSTKWISSFPLYTC